MPYARKALLTWQAGVYYHIYNRGAHKAALFREPENYVYVLEKLKHYRQENNVTVIAYCLQPNHYHLLLRQDGDQPAGKVPQAVFNSYAKAYNRKYQHSGTLFERRFCAKPVLSYDYLLHLCRYIHANPVKHGLVANLADWPWSNYLEWIGKRDGSLIDRVFVQEHFGNGDEYNHFVLEYLKSRMLPDAIKRFIFELER